jgi:ribosomal protein S18 acetylase RimI-like enzyme
MLQSSAGLGPDQLEAIADLEARTVSHDGGRLKLEWGSLRSRSGEQVEDLLWWDGDTLVGFLGIYSFGGGEAELAGMVDPSARGRGIATALIDAATPLLAQRGRATALLVCPRVTGGGAALAAARDAPLDHSEYSLVLRGTPTSAAEDPATMLRRPEISDLTIVSHLLEQGFGYPHDGMEEEFASQDDKHLVVVREDRVIGYIRCTVEEGRGGVYGFVIAESERGRGIGRDVLHRVCVLLRARGAEAVGLEVAVENDHALGLYTSLGFERVTTEDYFRLTVAPAIELV